MYYSATGLIPGALYQFKVKARNSIGLSTTFSDVISLYAAVKPNAPDAPVTTELNNYHKIAWVPASTDSFQAYGSAVTSYTIEIL